MMMMMIIIIIIIIGPLISHTEREMQVKGDSRNDKSITIIWVIKLRRMRLAGHVARMVPMKKCIQYFNRKT
jgi:hypothetical protein